MFTEQMQELDRLRGLGVPDAFIEGLKQTLGNCMQKLVHRGQVDLTTDGDQAGYPERPVMPACGDIGATLKVSNPASMAQLLNEGDDNERLSILNGVALQTCGPIVSVPSDFAINTENNVYNNITNYSTGVYVDYIVRFGDTNIWIDGVWMGPFGQIYVSSNDTTLGYLNGKAVAGSLITLTENNDGANETLTWAVKQQNSPSDGKIASYHAGTAAIRWIDSDAVPGADIYVKVDASDDADYLEAQMRDLASSTFSLTEDLILKCENVAHGSDGTRAIRYFIDASAISGYNAGNHQVLAHDESGTWKWYDITQCAV